MIIVGNLLHLMSSGAISCPNRMYLAHARLVASATHFNLAAALANSTDPESNAALLQNICGERRQK